MEVLGCNIECPGGKLGSNEYMCSLLAREAWDVVVSGFAEYLVEVVVSDRDAFQELLL